MIRRAFFAVLAGLFAFGRKPKAEPLGNVYFMKWVSKEELRKMYPPKPDDWQWTPEQIELFKAQNKVNRIYSHIINKL